MSHGGPDALPCPACGATLTGMSAAGRRLDRCGACHGVWIAEPVLAEMFAEMSHGKVTEVPFDRTYEGPSRRGCPSCAQPMPNLTIGLVAVERCAAHGVWFDHEELERTLHGAAPPPRPGVRDISSMDVRLVLDVLFLLAPDG